MEYVIVEYPDKRSVLIDDQDAGFTDETLMVEEGHHDFALAGEADYTPARQEVLVQNTTGDDPLVIVFAPVAPVEGGAEGGST